jgi:hypothetical protein
MLTDAPPLDDGPSHTEDGERVPPHSLEAEHGVLGCLLQDNTALALVGDLVDADSFYMAAHRWIYAAIAELLAQRIPADVITVFEQLAKMGVAEACDGLPYLVQLERGVPSARNARRYAEIVAERCLDRALIAGVGEAASMSWREDVPLADRMERIAGILARVEQQRKGPGRRVPVLKLEALREQHAAIRWAVKHVIPGSSIGMLFGGSGTFKSFIALDLALHVAHGLPWMGRVTQPGQVLYVAAEGGAGLWGRVEAWHRARNLSWADVPLYVVPQAVDLTVDAWRVVDAAQAIGALPTMVIVDTLSQTYAGEENSANEMAAYLREIGLRFRTLWDCAVLLIHHSGHEATERPRGSSAIRGNVDFMLGAFRDEKEMIATLQCKKQKDGELFKDAEFQLTTVTLGMDEDNEPVTSLVARHLGNDEERKRAREEEARAGRSGRNQSFIGLLDSCHEEKTLRRAYYELLGNIDADAKKKAYYRARDWAVQAGHMELAQGFVIDLRGKK